MKKDIIIFLIASLMWLTCALVFADKPTSYTTLEKVHGNITTNVLNPSDNKYYPIKVKLDGLAKTGDSGSKGVSVSYYLGTSQDEEFATPQEIYQASPAWAQPALKALWIEALNVDISEE